MFIHTVTVTVTVTVTATAYTIRRRFVAQNRGKVRKRDKNLIVTMRRVRRSKLAHVRSYSELHHQESPVPVSRSHLLVF